MLLLNRVLTVAPGSPARTAARGGRRSPSGPSGAGRPRRPAGGDPVGPGRPGPAADAWRHPGDRVGAPVAVVGALGVLRLASVQPHQRGPGRRRARSRSTGQLPDPGSPDRGAPSLTTERSRAGTSVVGERIRRCAAVVQGTLNLSGSRTSLAVSGWRGLPLWSCHDQTASHFPCPAERPVRAGPGADFATAAGAARGRAARQGHHRLGPHHPDRVDPEGLESHEGLGRRGGRGLGLRQRVLRQVGQHRAHPRVQHEAGHRCRRPRRAGHRPAIQHRRVRRGRAGQRDRRSALPARLRRSDAEGGRPEVPGRSSEGSRRDPGDRVGGGRRRPLRRRPLPQQLGSDRLQQLLRPADLGADLVAVVGTQGRHHPGHLQARILHGRKGASSR